MLAGFLFITGTGGGDFGAGSTGFAPAAVRICLAGDLAKLRTAAGVSTGRCGGAVIAIVELPTSNTDTTCPKRWACEVAPRNGSS